jgi:DNA-3-methyladenine glycosylase
LSAPEPLRQSFFARSALEVARDLIGCTFLFGGAGGRIVETEAYRQDDPCCHGYRGKTERNTFLFGPPGHLYVYFTYGMHFCANVSSEEEGVAAGVLLRALEPEYGVADMVARRGPLEPRLLASGPARLAQALGIGPRPGRSRASRRHHGAHRRARRRPGAVALRRRRQPLSLATADADSHSALWVR